MPAAELLGKVVFITGGKGELGRALAKVFREAGADVWASCYSSNLESDKDVAIDLHDTMKIQRAFRKVYDVTQRIDILINNAGVTHNGLLLADKDEQWNEVLDVNLQGMMRCCREVLKYMVPARRGVIINVSSLAALRSEVGQSIYAASKAGVESVTRTLALEVASKNIRVNAVAPGFLDTAMLKTLGQQRVHLLKEKVPLKRLGQVNEIALLVQWLASDQANYITGQTLRIDGGMGM
ncbi:MAG: SDR family oxidoreductase [Verrucomicrobiota bacterium]